MQVALRIKRVISLNITENIKILFFFDPWLNGSSLFELYGNNVFEWFTLPKSTMAKEQIFNQFWIFPTTELCPQCFSQLINSILVKMTLRHVHGFLARVAILSQIKLFTRISMITMTYLIGAIICGFVGYPLKFSLSAWKILNCGLKTTDILASHGVYINQIYVLYEDKLVSHNHLFIECTS